MDPLDPNILVKRVAEIGFYNLMSEIEHALIGKVLELTKDNASHAAELLGLNRTTLVHKRIKLGFHVPNRRPRAEVDLG